MGTLIHGTTAVPIAPNRDCKSVRFNPSGKCIAISTNEGSCLFFAAGVTTTDNRAQPLATLKCHDGPVWECAFAPLAFGSLCATCGADRKVAIYKENAFTGQWDLIYSDSNNRGSIRTVDFIASSLAPLNAFQLQTLPRNAPVGLHLASGSSDGSISVYSLLADHSWSKKQFPAHNGGVNSLRWSSGEISASNRTSAGDLAAMLVPNHRLASAGVDGQVAIWAYNESIGTWVVEARLYGHMRSVLDLCWMPYGDSCEDKIVSLGNDGTLIFWTRSLEDGLWIQEQRRERACPNGCKVRWSLDGSMIAVSPGITGSFPPLRIFKRSRDGWVCLDDESAQSLEPVAPALGPTPEFLS